MSNKTIKYIGFYSNPEKKNRTANLAAVNKMNYISDSIIKNNYKVEFVSASWLKKESKVKYESQQTIKINNNKKITFGPSYKSNISLINNFGKLFTLLWLLIYLLVNVKKNEKILVYHSPAIMIPVYLVKLIKKNKIILEVEEIYGEVWKKSTLSYELEKILLNKADCYIFVSEALKRKINTNKKSIILYGSYIRVPDYLNRIKEKKNDYIKIVYAGSIDHTKGGAFKSLEISKHLPKNYEVHILGHGEDLEIKSLKEKIEKTNRFLNREATKYIGTLHSEEYSKYLLGCDIAVNPQNMGEYMNSAFPSKIISYLAHDLIVVSTKLLGIETSSIKNHIMQVQSDSAVDFAETLKKIKVPIQKEENSIIKQLDVNFIKEINFLLNDI